MRLLSWLFRRRDDRARPQAPKREPAPAAREQPLAPKPAARPPAAAPAAVAVAPPDPPVVPRPSLDETDARAILEALLDDLGTARHRPFSRG